MALQAHLIRLRLTAPAVVLAAPAVLALLLAFAGPARADMLISVENNNSRGRVDHFEVIDDTCHRRFALTLGGRTSDTIEVCGGVGSPGALRIRYAGEEDWTGYDVRTWSVVLLPSRPRRLAPGRDDGDGP